MTKKTLLTVALIMLGFLRVLSQDLDSLLDAELNKELETEYAEATFKATRVVLGQSIENVAKGELNFIISHHFGTINQGAYQLFGLDQSSIRFGLEYGITKRLAIAYGRSSHNKIYDGSIKYKLIRQSKGKSNVPLSVSLFSNIGITTLDWAVPERDNLFESRLTYSFQLLIARKFTNKLSLQITPSMIHRNLVKTNEDENDAFSVGFAGRIKLSNRFSFNTEYFYLLPGKTADDFYDAFSVGFDIETGGHVFQLYVTNATGMIEQTFIPETNGSWNKGDIRIGFNISRVFTIVKNKTKMTESSY